jgi:hypothetical protein
MYSNQALTFYLEGYEKNLTPENLQVIIRGNILAITDNVGDISPQ